MKLSEIVAQAESFGLMMSREIHEVDLVFESPAQADRFVRWCAQRNIATQDHYGHSQVKVYTTG